MKLRLFWESQSAPDFPKTPWLGLELLMADSPCGVHIKWSKSSRRRATSKWREGGVGWFENESHLEPDLELELPKQDQVLYVEGMNILPTKLRLKSKGVGQEDKCDLCGLSESSGHILWGCNVAATVWSGTKIKLLSLPGPHLDFLDIVWIMENCPAVDWDLFVVLAWSLWNNRNSVRHGRQCKGHDVIVKEVTECFKGVKQAEQVQEIPPPTAKPPWTPLRQGCYKINVDGECARKWQCCWVH